MQNKLLKNKKCAKILSHTIEIWQVIRELNLGSLLSQLNYHYNRLEECICQSDSLHMVFALYSCSI